MNNFGNIAYVPKTMDNMFMGDIPFDTNVFHLLCDIYEDNPEEFHEFEDYAFMTTNTKDIKSGEILYAWFTLNRNSGATQKWYNSDFKTKSELEELGLINSMQTKPISTNEENHETKNSPSQETTSPKTIKIAKTNCYFNEIKINTYGSMTLMLLSMVRFIQTIDKIAWPMFFTIVILFVVLTIIVLIFLRIIIKI